MRKKRIVRRRRVVKRRPVKKRVVRKITSSSVPKGVLEEMKLIRNINRTSGRPENPSEWRQADKDARYYLEKLKKYPMLKRMGFDEDDIQWYSKWEM